MHTSKSAGSPAFMPPELCVARHGEVSGRAADIWSMGVTLYCLRYGRIPFEKYDMLELCDSIRDDELELPSETDESFIDLMHHILDKDPNKRITMKDLRVSARVGSFCSFSGSCSPRFIHGSQKTGRIIYFPKKRIAQIWWSLQQRKRRSTPSRGIWAI